MQLSAADFQKQYAGMSEDDLARIDRMSLGEIAQDCYVREVAYRASAEYRDKQRQDAAEAEAKAVAETKRCFFCGAEPVSADCAAHVEMHSGYERKRGFRTTTKRWIPQEVQVARCSRCQRVHRTERHVRILAGVLSIPVFGLLLLILVAGAQVGPAIFLIAPVLWYGLLLVGSSLLTWFLYLLPSCRKTNPIHHAYKSIAVERAMRAGWGKGAPLTFSWDLARMFRRFVGLVEVPRASQTSLSTGA